MVCCVLSKAHQFGPVRSRNFFDDIVSRVSWRGDNDGMEVLEDHSVRLAQCISDARLTYNEVKTVVVGSSVSIGRTFAARVAKRNLKLKVKRCTRYKIL